MFRRLRRNVGTKEAVGRERGVRAAALLTCVVGFALAAALLVPAAVAHGANGPKCSAEQGQALIDERRLDQAVREFTCVIEAGPTEVEGYRGRIEAELLLGRYSDALGDYARVTARVLPVHPDARNAVLAGYADRLRSAPADVAALTGASFARWAFFDYASAIHLLNRLLAVEPDGLYGNLFRGSSRLLQGGPGPDLRGETDLERALDLAPSSPDVHFVVADAYTYGLPDLERAFAEATLAFEGGLDTPRVHAILATAQNAFGDRLEAAGHIERHFELVTTELLPAPPLAAGDTLNLNLVPGRAYAIPIAVTAGETISVSTKSHDYWDSIAVLLAPDGSPVLGSDDDDAYFAAFDWVAEETGIYLLKVAFFEAVDTGELVVTRN